MENLKRLKRLKKAWICWNGANFSEPEYLAHPVVVFAENATLAKYAAWGDIGDVEETDEPPSFVEVRVRRDKDADIFQYKGRKENRATIERFIESDKWRKKMEDFVAANLSRKVYIYSGEHGMYWRSGRSGYSVQRDEAGVYAAEDAWDATSHCGLSKRITFENVK